MKIKIAYIGYVQYQNQPSKPELGEVHSGSIRQDIETLYKRCFGRKTKTEIMTDLDWGDVVIWQIKDGNNALYITFEKSKRKQALKELKER